MRFTKHFEIYFILLTSLASSECRRNHCGRNKWGTDCSKSCPENCLDLQGVVHCDISTSECLEGCIAGWYGNLCTISCNANCINGTCDQDNGNCSLGCDDGHVCNIPPPKREDPSEKCQQDKAIAISLGVLSSLLLICLVISVFSARKKWNKKQRTRNKSLNRKNTSAAAGHDVSALLNPAYSPVSGVTNIGQVSEREVCQLSARKLQQDNDR